MKTRTLPLIDRKMSLSRRLHLMASIQLLLVLSLLSLVAAAPLEPVSIDLGAENTSHGLSVPTGGDGSNTAQSIDGVACRRITGPGSAYMYVQADAKRVPPGCYDAYLAFDYLDDHTEIIRANYDKVDPTGDKRSWYTTSDDLILLTGGGGWRRGVIHLPDARFGHSENGKADLRLMAHDLAVRRIEVLFSKPADYRVRGIDPAKLEQFRSNIDAGMELDIGVDPNPAEAALFKAIGMTCAESYVTWQTVEDAGEGKWDWSRWDRQVDILQKAGLKWAPLLVAGPAYANPKWYRQSNQSVGYVCLEHNEATMIESLWNPAMRPWVERFIKAFADRYRDRGVIQIVRLGVSGIYGETLYPTGTKNTDWVFHITGPYHTHSGWWAGDRYAVADFRRAMQQRYADIARLNSAWNSHYASFDAVAPFLPEKAPSKRACVDFVEWYLQSMTDYAEFWLATTRKYLPDYPIYLSVGGAGEPILGADFSAQAKACPATGGRVRVTNEGSNYASNFSVTREASTAARAFGVDIGFEPASSVSPNGIVARLYNNAASGAAHYFDYMPNLMQEGPAIQHFARYAPLLGRRQPKVYAGLYLPKTSWDIDAGIPHASLKTAAVLRHRLDIEMLDRTSFPTPLGQSMKVLAIADAPYAEAREIESFRNWVSAGGILVVQSEVDKGKLLLRTPEGSDAERDSLLRLPPPGHHLVYASSGVGPRHFRLQIGPGDEAYLSGQWYAAEDSHMLSRAAKTFSRWTGDKAALALPCDCSVDNTLVLTALLTAHSLPGVNQVSINGTVVGAFDRTGVQTYRFRIPQRLLAGRPVAEVALDIHAFLPTDYGDSDSRRLGLAVGSAEMIAQGADSEPAVTTPLSWQVDWLQADACVKRIGAGAVLTVATDSNVALGQVVVEALTHPEHLIPGAHGVNIPLPDDAGVYATERSGGHLYYNSTDEVHQVNGVQVPAQGMAESK